MTEAEDKAALAEDIRYAIAQRGRKLGIRLDERKIEFLADEIVEHIYRSNWIIMKGAPTPPHSTHPIVSQIEHDTETAVIEGLIGEMEWHWLALPDGGETVGPVKNFTAWESLVRIIRKRLK